MHWFTAFVVFVMLWWTVLFAVLPFGTEPVEEPDELTGWRGAPARPRIAHKLLITTMISVVLWAISMAIISSDVLSFRGPLL